MFAFPFVAFFICLVLPSILFEFLVFAPIVLPVIVPVMALFLRQYFFTASIFFYTILYFSVKKTGFLLVSVQINGDL